MRKYYLDNIRWATVLLVLLYHVFYMFNAVGVLGGVGSFHKVQYQDGLLYFVYPWFMVLLFTIAGISAKYSLERRTEKAFLSARTWKLLVPSTIGLFVYQWIVGYYNIKNGGGLAYMPAFIIYPVSAISGVGPLWFAHVLWLFSLFLPAIRRIDKNERLWKSGEKCNAPLLLLFALFIWCGAQILNVPVFATYRFGIYLAAFLLGYFVLSHDSVQETLEKMCLPMLLLSMFMGIVYTIFYFGENYTDAVVLKSLFTNVYAWFMTLAVLGCGKRWFDKQNKWSAYMTKASYGFYVLHYTFVLIPCYYLKNGTSLPAWIVYILALLIVFIGTLVLYEFVRRIPVARCLILGIRREKHDKG